MTLTLVKNPKFAKRVEYTTEQKRDNFAEFYKLANKVHKLRQFGLAKNKEDLHWKDEMYAVIDPKDFNKFTTLKPYDKNVAKQKRIKELQENIVLYTCELRRFKEELIKLQNEEVA
jgi:hypothetical protein